MPIFKIDQVVKDKLFLTATHETQSVTVTATMSNGSALVAAGTEAAIAGVADVTMVIDEPNWDDKEFVVGEVIDVNVAVRGCVFAPSVIHFSDAGAFVPANATALIAQMNTFA